MMDREIRFLKVGFKNFGKAAVFQLTRTDTYLTAGAVVLGAALGSKSKEKAVEAGVFAMVGMVGFAVMHLGVPAATEEFMKEEGMTITEE